MCLSGLILRLGPLILQMFQVNFSKEISLKFLDLLLVGMFFLSYGSETLSWETDLLLLLLSSWREVKWWYLGQFSVHSKKQGIYHHLSLYAVYS